VLSVAGAAAGALAGAAELVVDAVSALLAPAGAASELAGAEAAELPPRKSVAYQPEPLSWKPAAVTCFLKAGALHWGQSFKGASDIFCKTSLVCPQDSHL